MGGLYARSRQVYPGRHVIGIDPDHGLRRAALLAEVGGDMKAFGTARRLASWAGMCPGSHESAGKSRGGKRRKGYVYLRRILCEVMHAPARTGGVQFGPSKHGLAIRRGTGRAVVATAHNILRHRVRDAARDGRPYRDPQVDHQARTAIRNRARWLKLLRKANLLQEVARAAAKQPGRRAGWDPRGAGASPLGRRIGAGSGPIEPYVERARQEARARGRHAHRVRA